MQRWLKRAGLILFFGLWAAAGLQIWERRNPTNYAIETSEDGSTWKAVKTFTSAPAEKEQIINLDNPVQTRYIRVRINTFNPTAEGITWKTVSIYEF